MGVTTLKIAAAQYPIDLLPSFEAWEEKVSRWVEGAARAEAELVLFPEYAAMELAGSDPAKAADLQASLDLVMDLGQAYDEVHRSLSVKHGIMVLAGSRPFRVGHDHIVNRAILYSPDGRSGYQDKIVMTRFERERWGVRGGTQVNAIDTPIGPVGISICYDVEFPLIARRQAEEGAKLILAPSATDTMQGYWRVRIGAQARALENQCFVVQAPTIGSAEWLPCLDENYGAAAIYCPPDGAAPDDGIIAIGTPSEPGWVFGEIELDDVERWRSEGTVLNFKHWDEQPSSVGAVLSVSSGGAQRCRSDAANDVIDPAAANAVSSRPA